MYRPVADLLAATRRADLMADAEHYRRAKLARHSPRSIHAPSARRSANRPCLDDRDSAAVTI
jgi:hypothetical protein